MGGQITHEVDAMCIMDACWCSYNQVSLTPFELLHSQAEIQSDCQTKPAVFYMHLSRAKHFKMCNLSLSKRLQGFKLFLGPLPLWNTEDQPILLH